MDPIAHRRSAAHVVAGDHESGIVAFQARESVHEHVEAFSRRERAEVQHDRTPSETDPRTEPASGWQVGEFAQIQRVRYHDAAWIGHAEGEALAAFGGGPRE